MPFTTNLSNLYNLYEKVLLIAQEVLYLAKANIYSRYEFVSWTMLFCQNFSFNWLFMMIFLEKQVKIHRIPFHYCLVNIWSCHFCNFLQYMYMYLLKLKGWRHIIPCCHSNQFMRECCSAKNHDWREERWYFSHDFVLVLHFWTKI